LPDFSQYVEKARLTFKLGHEFVLLEVSSVKGSGDLQHSDWLSTSQEEDAFATLQALEGRVWRWMIVDHYALDYRWEQMIRPMVGGIMVIDDLADRIHECDLLLDQNYYSDMASRYWGKVSPDCRLLLGPRYALLREEFRQIHTQVKPRTIEVKRVLVFFGGMDEGNYTALALDALAAIARPDVQVDVVIGAMHPAKEEIEEVCARHEFGCHIQIKNIAALMAAADMSIGAGGGAIWERCCLGLPTIAFCVAENQRQQLWDAAVAGLIYMPAVHKNIRQVIVDHVHSLIENPSLREMISANGIKAVDGRGAMRVASVLGVGICMREAKRNDSRDLYAWRNHAVIRAASRNTNLIEWDDHQRWFESVLADPNRILLLGSVQDFPVGVVRFDLTGVEAEISIYLVPEDLSSGMGAELLSASEQWLRTAVPQVRLIHAHVLAGNDRSMSLFANADYSLDITRYTKRLV
jgi:UDP-2,4-diacetamido-2,4,6-trideoxy-beta-L-altropyranose hydrolase